MPETPPMGQGGSQVSTPAGPASQAESQQWTLESDSGGAAVLFARDGSDTVAIVKAESLYDKLLGFDRAENRHDALAFSSPPPGHHFVEH